MSCNSAHFFLFVTFIGCSLSYLHCSNTTLPTSERTVQAIANSLGQGHPNSVAVVFHCGDSLPTQIKDIKPCNHSSALNGGTGIARGPQSRVVITAAHVTQHFFVHGDNRALCVIFQPTEHGFPIDCQSVAETYHPLVSYPSTEVEGEVRSLSKLLNFDLPDVAAIRLSRTPSALGASMAKEIRIADAPPSLQTFPTLHADGARKSGRPTWRQDSEDHAYAAGTQELTIHRSREKYYLLSFTPVKDNIFQGADLESGDSGGALYAETLAGQTVLYGLYVGKPKSNTLWSHTQIRQYAGLDPVDANVQHLMNDLSERPYPELIDYVQHDIEPETVTLDTYFQTHIFVRLDGATRRAPQRLSIKDWLATTFALIDGC